MPTPVNNIFLILFVWTAIGWCPQAAVEKMSYDGMVQKIKAGDRNIDFRGLRMASAESSAHPDTSERKKKMFAELKAEKYPDAIKSAEVVLNGDFADIDAHYVAFAANRALNNTEQADFHKWAFQGLIDSIMHSGDGKSMATAYEVVEVHEEYVVLRYLGLMPGEQSLLNQGAHSYDKMVAVDPRTNEKVQLFFNIDIEEKHLRDALR